MAVSRLALSHVRSHRRTVIEAAPGPVALFGPNGAGKTNVLEAVSLLSPGRGLRRAATDDIGRRGPDAPGWKIAAEVAHLGADHEIETWAEPGSARQVRIDGKAAPQAALGRILRVVWLVPAMDRLWTEGAEGRRRFLDRMTLSFEPGHAEAVLRYEKAMRERNRLLRDQVSDERWYTALEAQMAEAGAEIASNRSAALALVAGAQAEAGTGFPSADLEISWPGLEPGGADDLSRMLAESRHRDIAAGRTLIGPHRIDLTAVYAAKGMPAADASTGEQKALLISLVLANARALADRLGAPPVLLLDEVAAHLDEGRRAALYDEIVGLGAQAWLTGTGPELFAALGDRAQRFSVREEGGLSVLSDAGPGH